MFFVTLRVLKGGDRMVSTIMIYAVWLFMIIWLNFEMMKFKRQETGESKDNEETLKKNIVLPISVITQVVLLTIFWFGFQEYFVLQTKGFVR